jgi:hypothetical protein
MPEFDKSPIQKFNVPGQVAEGAFNGIRRGKFESNLIQIGNRTFGSSTVLDGHFKDVPIGTPVRVEYLGMVQPKKIGGKAYKSFAIQNMTLAPVGREDTTDYTPTDTTDTGDLTLTLLLSRIKAVKGENIMNILKAATAMSNDPVEALKDAMKQMGMDHVD